MIPTKLTAMSQAPLEIPWQALSTLALNGVIDEFLLREGTDYGAVEISHEQKKSQIRRQLEDGDICLIFDPERESTTLLSKREWLKLKAVFAKVSPKDSSPT